MKTKRLFVLPIVLAALPLIGRAQDATDRIAALEKSAAAAQASADNGWVLMSSALVLLMTVPGLALFYGG
ncbi:MAG: ammonia channel protein, partial [Acidobacteriota bacterium]